MNMRLRTVTRETTGVSLPRDLPLARSRLQSPSHPPCCRGSCFGLILAGEQKGEGGGALLHFHNPLRSLLLIQNASLDLPALALSDTHPRRRIAEAHLGVIENTLRNRTLSSIK